MKFVTDSMQPNMTAGRQQPQSRGAGRVPVPLDSLFHEDLIDVSV
jgi:hypothetical protein